MGPGVPTLVPTTKVVTFVCLLCLV
jgi:hypothetical protein